MNAVDRPEGEAPDLWLEEVHGEAALGFADPYAEGAA